MQKAEIGVEQEIVEQLRKSSKIIQHLTPIIVNQEGKTLSGRHRRLADLNRPTTVYILQPHEVECRARYIQHIRGAALVHSRDLPIKLVNTTPRRRGGDELK